MTALEDLAKVGKGDDWIVGVFQDVRQEKLKGAVDRLNDIAGNIRKVAADMDWRGDAADQAKTAFMTLAGKLNEHADAINAIRQADADTHDPIHDAREAWNFLELTMTGLFDDTLLADVKYEGEEPDETRERLARQAMTTLDSGMHGAQSRIATGVTWDLDVPATPATPPVAGPPVPKDPKPAPEPGGTSDPAPPAPSTDGGSTTTVPSGNSGAGSSGSSGSGNGGADGGSGSSDAGSTQVHSTSAANPNPQLVPSGHGNGDHGNGSDAVVRPVHHGGGAGNGAPGNGAQGNGAPGNGQHVQWQSSDGQWHNAVGHQVQWQDAHGTWHDAAGTGDHPNASQVRWQDSDGQWHQADGQWEDSTGQWHEARGPDAVAVEATATDGADLTAPVAPPVADPGPIDTGPADTLHVDAAPTDAAPTDAAPTDVPPADAAGREDFAAMLARRLGGDPTDGTVTVDVAAASHSTT